MKTRKPIICITLCLVAAFVAEAAAQGPGGDPGGFAARMLRRLDRNEDGALDPDELEQAEQLRSYLERHDVDVSRPVPLGVAADHQSGMYQEMRERGEFPGGPPGGFGGPGGGPPGGDRRGDGGDRSGRDSGSNAGSREGTREERRSARGRRGEGTPPGGPGMPNGKTDPKSKVRVGRVGPKANLPALKLPAQYAARDINQDGQIGMYEWSRTDLSTFRRMDRDGDGFVTPAELASPGTGSGGSATTASTALPGSTGSGSTGSGFSSTATKPAAGAAEPPADLKTVAAQGAFDLLDKDKNNELSDEEFNRSRYAKKLFTEGKVEFKLPISKAKFVEIYTKLAP